LIFGPAIFDHNIFAFRVALLIQALTKCAQAISHGLSRPITGIADCCARAGYGDGIALPARNVMNSRRLMGYPKAKDR
jgi:hypothetical protein